MTSASSGTPKFSTIAVGQKLPDVKLFWLDEAPGSIDSPVCRKGDIKSLTTSEAFKGKRVALFGVPGALTPTCSERHLPEFINSHDELRKHGVDLVACVAVNDPFVMAYWGSLNKAHGKVLLLSDGNGDLAKATGLSVDLTAKGLGHRCKRFSMLLDDLTVTHLFVDPTAYSTTSAANLLSVLQAAKK
eukprot:GILK01002611.1.p1 GENE.GILK01002611.1~~GILK01002611.1.p1  ORF type:complete len:214 (-),score=26.83 GILK01002611.1:267-830(-)